MLEPDLENNSHSCKATAYEADWNNVFLLQIRSSGAVRGAKRLGVAQNLGLDAVCWFRLGAHC